MLKNGQDNKKTNFYGSTKKVTMKDNELEKKREELTPLILQEKFLLEWKDKFLDYDTGSFETMAKLYAHYSKYIKDKGRLPLRRRPFAITIKSLYKEQINSSVVKISYVGESKIRGVVIKKRKKN